MIAEMQEYYRRRAGVYDHSMGYDNPVVVKKLTPVIEHLQESLRGRDVLEIACGPGFWTQFVAESASTVTAVDYNEETLAEARKKAMRWDRVSLQVGDAYDLPVFDKVFDGFFAVDWISHVPRRLMSSFLEGLHRRMAPDAVMIFCDSLPREGSLTGRFEAHGDHLQERLLPDGSRHRVIKNYLGKADFLGFLDESASLSYTEFPGCKRYVASYVANPVALPCRA